MKRAWIIGICLSMVLTGCFKQPAAEQEGADVPQVEGPVTDDGPAGTAIQPLRLQIDNSWSDVQTPVLDRPAMTVPEFQASVPRYTIAGDLSNVANLDRFTGFTADQRKMLASNGFVVLPSTDTKMHYIYDQNEYQAIPNFITSDSVLHMFHHFYDKSLMYVESSALYDELRALTGQTVEKSVLLHQALEDEQLKKLQENNIMFFLIAHLLMEPDAAIAANIEDKHRKLAEQELALIREADTFERSPLLSIDLDYSQFTIRGHYTRSDELGRYFQTMMWLGTAPLPFFDEEQFLYENTLQALLMSFATFLEYGESSDAERWSNIYGPTSQYAGLSDDIHVFAMNRLRSEVYGDSSDPNLFNDEAYYDKLYEAVKALPEPRIQGKLTSVTTPTGKQFRYMGQRYVLDSYVMQELMEPIVRPVPSGLDVMGVLGSAAAEELLLNHYKPQELWPAYVDVYKSLREEAAGYDTDVWGENLYNGWLWSIQEALAEYEPDSGMPGFMTTDAWRKKSLNAALGSYAELKHDTVLYGKQPVAQMGGPLDTAKQHYVEPNVLLYGKLLYLTDHTLAVLEHRGMLSDRIRDGAEQYRQLLQLLIDCSVKQLKQMPLTEEENEQLLWYGGMMEQITMQLLMGLSEDGSDQEFSDMLVSDVATIAPNASSAGGNLSLGTGYYDHIYVVVPVGDTLQLARGSVYSYYEFVSDKRLTDEQWWDLHGLKKRTMEYGSYLEMTEPSDELPEQPFWVRAFKSDSNLVQVAELEVDWDNLNE